MTELPEQLKVTSTWMKLAMSEIEQLIRDDIIKEIKEHNDQHMIDILYGEFGEDL
jgi:hypothetical protein